MRRTFYILDSLIDPDDPNAAAWSRKTSVRTGDMNDQVGTTGFGQLVGSITRVDGSNVSFLLTPRKP